MLLQGVESDLAQGVKGLPALAVEHEEVRVLGDVAGEPSDGDLPVPPPKLTGKNKIVSKNE